MNNRVYGAKGEEMAVSFLLKQGYQIITKNWAVKYGELDLVALAPDRSLVFVEVKRVSSRSYGDAAQKVTPHKIQQIRKLAGHYMSERSMVGVNARIDVVAITEEDINLYKNCVTLT